jgi:hypothetical protein
MMNTVTRAPRMARPVMKARPMVMLPVKSLTNPISVGLTKPPRMPIELITAIPVAAASAVR